MTFTLADIEAAQGTESIKSLIDCLGCVPFELQKWALDNIRAPKDENTQVKAAYIIKRAGLKVR